MKNRRMNNEEQLEPREERVERLQSVQRIALFGMVFCAALTVCGLIYADEIKVGRIAIGIVGAAFVLAFSVQRLKAKQHVAQLITENDQ